jgi:hypothetical protein
MSRNSLKNVIRLIDEAKKILPVEQSFLNDLKRSIELTADKEKRKGSQSYKPSSMNCIRQMFYIVTGKEPEHLGENYTSVGICNAGTDIHQRIQQAVLDMKKNDMDCEYVNVADYVRSRNLDYLEIVKEPNFKKYDYETKLFHKTLNMSFLCDGIIKYKDIYYILELKTENTNKFWTREGVDASHYNQGTAYSLSLGIDNVLFVYINRDILDMKSFMFTPTDEMKQDLVGRIQECDEYVKKLIAPPKPADVARKTCEYCDYKAQCRKDG